MSVQKEEIEKVFAAFQYPLFYIQRNIDDEIVVYEADIRDRDIVGVKMTWSSLKNLSERTPVSAEARRAFYEVYVKPHPTKKHCALLHCKLLSQPVELILKRKKHTDGRKGPIYVVAKYPIQQKECRVKRVYTDITTFPPSMNGLWINAYFNDEVISEQMAVDNSLIEGVDLTRFLG
jgi:hypothetical protein